MSANIPDSGKNGTTASASPPRRGEGMGERSGNAGTTGRALVLGGGGITGIAWEIGVLYGLAEAGIDLTNADTIIGTSAGSVVGAMIARGEPLHKLYAEQLAPPSGIAGAHLGRTFAIRWMLAMLLPGSRQQARARLGRAALRARTGPESERRAVFAGLGEGWPQRNLLITAVDAHSGEPEVFDCASGVPLMDAVAASCAVPLIWPPITINGRRYVDGGVRSPANVDLATGHARIVVIAPLVQSFHREAWPAAQVAAMGPGVRSALVSPDAAALRAIGTNVLDPAHQADAAHAGYAQASSALSAVRAVWEES